MLPRFLLLDMWALFIRLFPSWSHADRTASFQRSQILSSHVFLFNSRHFSKDTSLKPLWFMLNQPLERRIRLCCLAEANQYGIPKSRVEGMNTQDRFLGWQTTVLMILWGSVFLLFQLRHNTFSLNMGWLGNLIQRVLLCLSGYWALP